MPAQGHAFLRTVEEGIAVSTFGWKDFSQSRNVLAALTKALRNHFTAEIEHRTPTKKNYLVRRVDPYKLWYANGGLYLIAWDYRKEQFLAFAIERIRSVKLTNNRFTERPDFDFEKLHESAFNMIWGEPQMVRIRFSAGLIASLSPTIDSWPLRTIASPSAGGTMLTAARRRS